jgi:glycosyltransferase involved in cell wall biosynthesis
VLATTIETTAAVDDRIQTIFEFVPESALQRYMNAADVVVLPFREVLTSGSVMLALSFAKPVVTPDAGCIRTLMADTGGFTYDPGGLRRTLERTAAVDLERVSRENYQVACRYDWDTIGRATYAAYADTTLDVSQDEA